MMKKTKIYTTFLFTILIISVSLNPFAFLKETETFQTDEIILHAGYNDQFVLDEEKMSYLEQWSEEQASDSQINVKALDYEEPTDPTEPTETSVVFEDQTSKEITAEWITVGFLQYALTGSIDPFTEDYQLQEGFILNPKDKNSWISSDIADYLLIYQYATYAKLFNETIGGATESMTPVSYIATFGQKYDQIADQSITDGYNNTTYLSLWNDNYSPIFTSDTLNLLSKTIEYQLDIATFIYIYAYLWQKADNDKYDYKLTGWMNEKRLAIYWITNVTSSVYFSREAYKENWWTIGEDNDQDYVANWNEYDSSRYADSDKQAQLTPDGKYGFSGLISETDSSLSVNNEFWDYDHLWTWTTDPYQTTHSTEFGDQEFLQPTAYKDSTNSYIISSTDEETGESSSSMFMYSLIYPFAFPDETINEDLEAESWYYTINAFQDSSDADKFYYQDEDNQGYEEVSWFDVMSENLTYYDNEQENSDLFQIALIYSMYHLSQTDEQNLQNSAYDYWNNRGFYIELSGKYEKDYQNLIPGGLLKD